MPSPPTVDPFISSSLFFFPPFFFVFYKFPLKTSQFVTMHSFKAESTYHLCRQLKTSLIASVLQSGSRLITDTAKKSSLWDIPCHYLVPSLFPVIYSLTARDYGTRYYSLETNSVMSVFPFNVRVLSLHAADVNRFRTFLDIFIDFLI